MPGVELSRRSVLITGGGTGIGLEAARQLRLLGNEVLICGRRADRLEAAMRCIPGARAIACDIGRDEGLELLLEYVQKERLKIDTLMNNAGVQVQTDLAVAEDSVLEAIEEELRINLIAPIKLTKRLLPMLLAAPRGAIVNIVSLLGVMPKGNAPGYCASKGGLIAFSKSLRAALAEARVEVFIVYPPLVDTPMTHGRGSNKMPVEDFVREMLRQMAAGRLDISVGQARALLALDRLLPGVALRWTRRISRGATLPIKPTS